MALSQLWNGERLGRGLELFADVLRHRVELVGTLHSSSMGRSTLSGEEVVAFRIVPPLEPEVSDRHKSLWCTVMY
jgi:hypothetical protein